MSETVRRPTAHRHHRRKRAPQKKPALQMRRTGCRSAGICRITLSQRPGGLLRTVAVTHAHTTHSREHSLARGLHREECWAWPHCGARR